MPDLSKLTIKKASSLLEGKKLSSLELTQYYLSRIKKLNPTLNAYLTVCEKEALTQAQAADERIRKGQRKGILDGLPLAIKDNLCTAGIRTTAGSRMLENFIPPYDAFVIEKLKEAGAVILGKTNLDEFAMGSSTESSFWGPTKNPYDLTRVSGGSSGGSAVAVAADLSLAALGSDTGGSIRQPAAFCGVVGFKPTYGVVSRFGLIAMASSFDQIGPLTRTVEDSKILIRIIGQKDSQDATSVGFQKSSSKFKLKGLKVGWPQEFFGRGLDPRIKKLIKERLAKLERLGVKVIKVSLPSSLYALASYYIIMPAEVSSNLGRYDGIKYGFSKINQPKDLLEVYLKSRSWGFGEEVKRRIMLGTYVLSAGYYQAYYLQAQKVRAVIKKEFDRAFQKVDLLVSPTTPTLAFKIGEKTHDPLAMYLSDVYTVLANILGLPAISLPAGYLEEEGKKLPAGFQLMGQQFADELVLEAAKAFEKLGGGND